MSTIEPFARYGCHYTRMLNRRPSEQISPDDASTYRRPWLVGVGKEAAILDIGCGFGHQLYLLRALGFTNLYGIEISPHSLAVAREELGSSAELELVDAFDFLPRHREHFDLITLNDVLEHVPRERTVELLGLIHAALRSEGKMVVRVPNMASLLAQWSLYLDFTHLAGFTEYSLFQVLDWAGFKEHTIVYPERGINWRMYRPWRPLRHLGLKGMLNDWLHRAFYALRQQAPMPTVFDYNLEVFSTKAISDYTTSRVSGMQVPSLRVM
jgi:SAM-dependent methyltransferase